MWDVQCQKQLSLFIHTVPVCYEDCFIFYTCIACQATTFDVGGLFKVVKIGMYENKNVPFCAVTSLYSVPGAPLSTVSRHFRSVMVSFQCVYVLLYIPDLDGTAELVLFSKF